MEYEKFEALQKQQEKINDELLDEFSSFLLATGLKAKTVKNHINNLDFFLNCFLLDTDLILPEEGIVELDSYFSDFFPRKAMWSSPTSVNSTCASVKKFYLFLLDKKMITKSEFQLLNVVIKTEKIEWLSHYVTPDDWW